ncbi:TPA: hypothetical protein QC448_003620 [Bacillus cereus]|uniref:hypothetical protein n=1 Tax=Bacillus TaxID=1386 RepID=UPI000BF77E82|nr:MULTISPECIES: hypothetical protein [Bacillus]HDR8129176.1 hypothetical protein [Bacillus cereus]MBM6645103.1 hypothetical protein [Bacillus sp. RIT 809]MED2985141.1 hypothetical protein [Bacillus thuringiensis]MRB56239.1 hypothetical protein [Bacillus thuringiensis]PFU71778.1 hypothetical protein COK95_07345 [Bacillus thuringiensis]
MTSPTVNLNIKDVKVDVSTDGTFGNEDGTSLMKITTIEEYSLCLYFFVNIKNNVIGAVNTHTIGNICPCCKVKILQCEELNRSENKKKVLEDAYTWMKKAEKYRLQLLLSKYGNLNVIG